MPFFDLIGRTSRLGKRENAGKREACVRCKPNSEDALRSYGVDLRNEDSKPDGVAAPSRGLAYWADIARPGEKVYSRTIDEMAAHPRFAEACRASLTRAVARASRDPVMNRLSKNLTRLVYAYMVLYLEARGDITLKAIKELCREMDLWSAGRAQALLFHLRAIGYLARDPDNTDRRSPRYIASPEMKAALREVLVDDLNAFSLIEPEAAMAAERVTEPEFFRAFMRQMGSGIVAAMKFRPKRLISHFAERDAGLVMLWEVLLSAQEGDSFPPRGPLKMSLIALARKYAVSRAHVFRVFSKAEELGLLTRDADRQTGVITEPFAQDIREYQTIVFMGFAKCAQVAFDETAARTHSAA